LSCLNNITKLVGVDVNPTRINSAKHMFDTEFDVRVNRHIRRKADLTIELFRGNVTDECDPRVRGVDLVSCIELIEHVDQNQHSSLIRAIFESIKPAYVLITTPNIEFNQHWPNLANGEFRHDDHRFEWNRSEFRDFAEAVIEKYSDYSVSYDGIGPHWGNNHSYGYCSQVAIFKRKSIPVDDMIPIFNPGDRDLRTGL
jgi:hypothetical protein